MDCAQSESLTSAGLFPPRSVGGVPWRVFYHDPADHRPMRHIDEHYRRVDVSSYHLRLTAI